MNIQPAILRILDANLNRAREGLRVVEEFARFVLEDASLSEALKQLRHELVAAIPKGIATTLHAHRDSRRDVGREIANPSDAQRGSAGDVAQASAARVAEALRSIEEYAKPLDAVFAARVEPLRYRMYELQRRLSATMSARKKFGDIGVYVIITAELCARDWFETATLAVEGGAGAIQLREKGLCDGELLHRARRLSSLCHERGTIFLVNDRPDIALLSHADGVHVGQDDLSVADVRRMVPASMIVGLSTHTREQIDRAITDAPDYIAVGPMFPTATKPQEHVAGPATLAYAQSRTSMPLVAIGGITPENASQVLAVAPCALCVCAAVVVAEDPEESTKQLAAIPRYAQEAGRPD